MNYKHWCIIFLIALISCKNDAELDVKIELSEHYDLSMVSTELKAQGANCNLINNELYCASSDMSIVNNIIRNISLREFPTESVYLGMPGLHEAVIKELDYRKIPYKVQILKNKKWLIVQEKDLNLLNDIIDKKTYELRLAENQ